ncbi:hypothetical protein B0H14DRAFT_3508099 [Mycena olivaceomarginata]|nr:hypothetical protein B0H14DRAFT_3508099 [Mycena olivaceomarginata]
MHLGAREINTMLWFHGWVDARYTVVTALHASHSLAPLLSSLYVRHVALRLALAHSAMRVVRSMKRFSLRDADFLHLLSASALVAPAHAAPALVASHRLASPSTSQLFSSPITAGAFTRPRSRRSHRRRSFRAPPQPPAHSYCFSTVTLPSSSIFPARLNPHSCAILPRARSGVRPSFAESETQKNMSLPLASAIVCVAGARDAAVLGVMRDTLCAIGLRGRRARARTCPPHASPSYLFDPSSRCAIPSSPPPPFVCGLFPFHTLVLRCFPVDVVAVAVLPFRFPFTVTARRSSGIGLRRDRLSPAARTQHLGYAVVFFDDPSSQTPAPTRRLWRSTTTQIIYRACAGDAAQSFAVGFVV